MRVVTRNAIRCKICGDIIESKTIHDFQMCSCGACYVYGGTDYVRIGGDYENIELLTEYGDIPGYYITYYSMFGSKYTTSTTKNINDIIRLYEDGGNYVIVEDEQHDEIYRTPGIERVIAANEHRTTPIITSINTDHQEH